MNHNSCHSPLRHLSTIDNEMHDLTPSQAFLTHNGQLLGSAFPSIRTTLESVALYPCVGLHSQGEAVRLNFGQRPFLFDLSAWVAEEDGREQAAVSAVPVCSSLVRCLVRDYLLHQVCQNCVCDASFWGGQVWKEFDFARKDGMRQGAVEV